MKRFLSIALIICAILPLSSCGEKKKSPKPAISGAAGEIMCVMTRGQWQGEVGNSLRTVLADSYPFLPQKEVIFNLTSIPASAVNTIIKTHRNMIYLQVEDTCQCGLKVRKDVWAAPQTMLIITAPNEIAAAEYILERREAVLATFENAERDRSMANARLYEDKSVRLVVEDIFGGSPYFPKGYTIKKQARDFIWISSETSFTIQGVLIYKYPYTGNFQFTPGNLIEKRNEVARANVPATAEGSYMITNPNIIPGCKMVAYNGISRRELRSLWDTYGDFMGGPFISHAFLSQDGTEVIVAEGFVYAPKYNKRNYLRQMEAIVSSFHWKE